MKKRILAVLMALCMMSGTVIVPVDKSVKASETIENDTVSAYENFIYEVSILGDVSITGYVEEEGVTEIVIPSEIDGNKVTIIGSNAFKDCTNLVSVKVPDTVELISIQAFKGCTNLKNIELPSNLQTMWDRVFENCTSLSKIKLPSSLSSLPDGLFLNCTSLLDVEMPENVTHIGTMAFYNCSNLNTIEICEEISYIGGMAFEGTPWLQDKLIENPILVINGILVAFTGINESIEIPDTVTTLPGAIFRRYNNLRCKLVKKIKHY